MNKLTTQQNSQPKDKSYYYSYYHKRDDEEMYFYFGDINSPLTFARTGITYPSPKYEIYRKSAPGYSIEYVYEGEGVIQHNSNIYKVSAGDCFILHQNCFHHYFANPKNPWKKIWILVEENCVFTSHLIKDYGLNDVVYIKNHNNPTKFENCYEIIKQTADKENLPIALHALISDIANHYNSSGELSYDIVNKFKTILENNINKQFQIREACRMVGMGKTQMTFLFKSKYNITPLQYYYEKKISAIKSHLEQSDMSLTDIAQLYGFKSLYHFSSFFKKKVGIPPSEFRNNLHNIS